MYKRLYLKNKNLWDTPFENHMQFYFLAFFLWSERVLLEHKEE
jgi:hypothetical protein